MNKKNYMLFLGDFPKIIDDASDKFWGPLESIAKTAFGADTAKRIAKMGTIGIVFDSMCVNSDGFFVQNYCHKILSYINKEIKAVFTAVNTALFFTSATLQAWDSIPTWDEYKEYLIHDLETKISQIIKSGIPGLIKSLVCGNSFDVKVSLSLKSVFSEQLIKETVLVATKAVWDKWQE